MKKKIIGILVCTLLIATVYSVMATSVDVEIKEDVVLLNFGDTLDQSQTEFDEGGYAGIVNG